jgi:hypothetical protein
MECVQLAAALGTITESAGKPDAQTLRDIDNP